MGTALLGMNIIDIREDIFIIAISILKSYFYLHFICFCFKMDNIMQDIFIFINIFNEVLYPTRILIQCLTTITLIDKSDS